MNPEIRTFEKGIALARRYGRLSSSTNRLRRRLTPYGNINVRGGNGISNYNAMNVRYDIQDSSHTGIALRANYTWSHAIDELSDTFSASSNQFNLGYTNPFDPSLDYGDAEFDNLQVVISMVDALPSFRHTSGFMRYLLDGCQFAPIFTARTGAPYSIYDLTNAVNVCPRLMYPGNLGITNNVPRMITGPTHIKCSTSRARPRTQTRSPEIRTLVHVPPT